MTESYLKIENVTCQYGGLVAVDQFSLEIERGELHALIGPNGAGKSTLINLLAGQSLPSSGHIHLAGHNITHLPPSARTRLGLGRSFQRTNIFASLTCLENCWLGAKSREKTAMQFFRPAQHQRHITEKAMNALANCHLADKAHTPANQLSHGEQRQLEIAMLLASEPQLLLLDEPLAGLGAEESEQMADFLRALAQNHTLVLVEHDMDAVFRISDRITVMVNGRALQTDTPTKIRNNSRVRETYLGETQETPA